MFILTDWAMAVALVLLFIQLVFRRVRIVEIRTLIFALTSYVVGPGLIVNAFLKSYSGRARPRQIELFGGEKTFSPALSFADQCEKNCSFVSGEASTLATVSAILLLVVAPRLPGYLRVIFSVCVLAVAFFGSGLRVAFGAHFLSDVLFAWVISVSVVLSLQAIFNEDRTCSRRI